MTATTLDLRYGTHELLASLAWGAQVTIVYRWQKAGVLSPYNGANGKKIAVRYDGDVWLPKFPPSAADRLTVLSYTNRCLSEHLASTISNMIGLKSQETR